MNKTDGKRSLLCVAGLFVSIIAPVMLFVARILGAAYNNYTFGVQFAIVLALIMPLGGLALSIAGVVIARKHDLRGVNSGIVGILISGVEVLLIILLVIFMANYLSQAHTTPPDYTIARHNPEDAVNVKATIESVLNSDSEAEQTFATKSVELGFILGYENCYAEVENTGPGHYSWRIYNSEGQQIACQFGFSCEDNPDIVIVDVDGDGNNDLISNCCYGADGIERLYVFINKDDTIEVGVFNIEKYEEEQGIAVDSNDYKIYYSEESNCLIFHNNSDDSEKVLSTDDFVFEEYTSESF